MTRRRINKQRSGIRYSGDSIDDDIEGIQRETQKHLEETARLHREAEKHRKESRMWIAISFGIIGLAVIIDQTRSKKV